MNLKIHYGYNLCSKLNPMIFCKYSVSYKYEKLSIPFHLKKGFPCIFYTNFTNTNYEKIFFSFPQIYISGISHILHYKHYVIIVYFFTLRNGK